MLRHTEMSVDNKGKVQLYIGEIVKRSTCKKVGLGQRTQTMPCSGIKEQKHRADTDHA
jgi:hypothetical protein